jgi:hypothetical protein
MKKEDDEKIFIANEEVLEKYTKLINTPEFDFYRLDLKRIYDDIDQELRGNWMARDSGCKDYARYKYILGLLHAICKCMNAPEAFIEEARINIERIKKDKERIERENKE